MNKSQVRDVLETRFYFAHFSSKLIDSPTLMLSDEENENNTANKVGDNENEQQNIQIVAPIIELQQMNGNNNNNEENDNKFIWGTNISVSDCKNKIKTFFESFRIDNAFPYIKLLKDVTTNKKIAYISHF